VNPAFAESTAVPVPPEVYEFARQGKQALAIKAYCEATGADLRTGRDFVASL
jgi:hypothetical protein